MPVLVDALEGEEVLTHPFVIGELACGELHSRREFLDLLATLPMADVATDAEVLRLIEDRRLMGKGLGYIAIHLLASAMLTEATGFWTTDKRLQTIAAQLRIAI